MPGANEQRNLVRGTLDAMILKVLSAGPDHGYGVARAIEAASGGHLLVEEGSLYPALHRLAKRGDLAAEWRPTELNRRGKYYSLTPRGRRRLAAEIAAWTESSTSVSRVLGINRPRLAGESA